MTVGIKLPRKAPGQTVDDYLDRLASTVEQALQQLAPTPGRPPVITGAKGGNTALASLLQALATAGTVTDQTT